MSVSNYTPGKCKYNYSRLKDVVYLIPEEHLKKIRIDNGVAYVSGLTADTLKLEGYGIEFNEETSLDERYKFQKTLKLSVNGIPDFVIYRWVELDPTNNYICDMGDKYAKEILQEKHEYTFNGYYFVLETIDGTFYMVNVDFPSKATYVYNLSKNVNKTDFTFTSLSNYPCLELVGFEPDREEYCHNYLISGPESLRMLERQKTLFKTDSKKVISTEAFKEIDYIGETLSFQETFDGEKYQDTLEFQIGFDDYKTSWQYNLLEFVQNRYSAIVDLKNDDKKIYVGFNFGLEANYTIDASNEKAKSDIITITLTDTSNGKIIYGNYPEEIDSSTHWNYIKQIGNYKTYECSGSTGVAKYLVQEEYNAIGYPTGNYKVLNGYQDMYFFLNLIGTFNNTETFDNPECLNEIDPIYRWVSDGTTCVGYNKYSQQKEQVSYDNGATWEDTGEVMPKALIEANSEDCGYVPPTPIEPQYRTISGTPYCNGYDKYVTKYGQISYDSGETWTTTSTTEQFVEANSQYCGYNPPEPTGCTAFIVDGGSWNDVPSTGASACDSALFLEDGTPVGKPDWVTINLYRWDRDDADKMCSNYASYPCVANNLMYQAGLVDSPIQNCDSEHNPPLSSMPELVQGAVNKTNKYADALGTVEYVVAPNTGSTSRSCTIRWYVDNEECLSKAYSITQLGTGQTQYRTVSGDPYCSGYTKMVTSYDQVSFDGGSTWTTTGWHDNVIEEESADCGYSPGCDCSTFELYGLGVAVSSAITTQEYTLARYTGATGCQVPLTITWTSGLADFIGDWRYDGSYIYGKVKARNINSGRQSVYTVRQGDCTGTIYVYQQKGAEAPTEDVFKWWMQGHETSYSATVQGNLLSIEHFNSALNGEYVNAVISANVPWIITSGYMYYNNNEFKPNQGNDIYMQDNNTGADRTGVLTLTQKGGTSAITCTITQQAIPPDCSITAFSMDTTACTEDKIRFSLDVADTACTESIFLQFRDAGSHGLYDTVTPSGGHASGWFDTSDANVGQGYCEVNGTRYYCTISDCNSYCNFSIMNATMETIEIDSVHFYNGTTGDDILVNLGDTYTIGSNSSRTINHIKITNEVGETFQTILVSGDYMYETNASSGTITNGSTYTFRVTGRMN